MNLDSQVEGPLSQLASQDGHRADVPGQQDQLGSTLDDLPFEVDGHGLGVALPGVLGTRLDPPLRQGTSADLVDGVVATVHGLRRRTAAPVRAPRDVRAVAVHDDEQIVDRLVARASRLQQLGNGAVDAALHRRRFTQGPIDEDARRRSRRPPCRAGRRSAGGEARLWASISSRSGPAPSRSRSRRTAFHRFSISRSPTSPSLVASR